MSPDHDRTRRKYGEEFLLKPSERDVYGATVTVRDLETGRTRTFARTGMTSVQAVLGVIAELDLLNTTGERWRIVTISTPNSIQRDIFASRIILASPEGTHDQTKVKHTSPESMMLGRLGRLDLLAPGIYRPPSYAGPKLR